MDGRIAALEVYTNEMKAARVRERLSVEEANTAVSSQRFIHLDSQLDRLEDKVDKIADKVGAR
jgi:outer membrane murein-binding lipoprotein Lpp